MNPLRGANVFLLSGTLAFSMTLPMSAQETIRFATFNVSLYGEATGQVQRRLESRDDIQASKIAAIIQKIRPDVLLLNEIDYDAASETLDSFHEYYLKIGQRGLQRINYPFRYSVPSNTGISSNLDIDGDGDAIDPGDSWGYGTYPGQYSMAVLSRYPFEVDSIRTFQKFQWHELPGALQPRHAANNQPFYPEATWSKLRLSSKNHIDVPIRIKDSVIHLLACHPTPPVFDGPEDRNGCRNHDEIRFWNEYLADSSRLVDDAGRPGGLGKRQPFVIAGDLNSDPNAGDSRRSAIQRLLSHKRVQDPVPSSEGALEASQRQQPNATSAFGASRLMRLDYVLPSNDLTIRDSGVFWPKVSDQDRELIDASDHRMVWIEIELPQ
jgi:endonuclease/exonuclease/phosphatase family metal-dependent hydrolase